MSPGAAGYDPGFLGEAVPLPGSSASPGDLVELDYTHFTVRQNTVRRLAEITAVNIDGARLVDLGRGDDWHLDERLPEDQQAGPEIYANNSLDRGHLVRRRDPVWGPDAQEANFDTFAFPNAAPQVDMFNQSKALWLGLEDYLLGFADTRDLRLTVFTAPVLAATDPPYRGLLVPKKFWKIAAWSSPRGLASTAYLLDQGPLLDSLTQPAAWTVDDPPELGPFLTFQLSVDEVARLTGLDLALLAAVDRYRPPRGLRANDWTKLHDYADIRL